MLQQITPSQAVGSNGLLAAPSPYKKLGREA